VQKPLALSFQVPALALPDCSSGSRVIFPSGVNVILNFAPEGDAAVNGCPVKKVVFISFGAIGSAAKAARAPKSIDIAIKTYAQHAKISLPSAAPKVISLAIYCKLLKARVGGQLIAAHAVAKKMSIRPPEYKPPLRRAYTNLGWIFAALTGPATLLAVWIYCAVTYGFLLGFFLGWIPALILALLVAVATIFLWPLAAVAVLYVIYRVFGVHPELLIYIAAFVGVIAIAMIWWWHVGNNKL
jgi:hypothetical protein